MRHRLSRGLWCRSSVPCLFLQTEILLQNSHEVTRCVTQHRAGPAGVIEVMAAHPVVVCICDPGPTVPQTAPGLEQQRRKARHKGWDRDELPPEVHGPGGSFYEGPKGQIFAAQN